MSITRSSVRWLAAELQVRRDLLEAVDVRLARYYKPFSIPRPGKKPRQIDRPIGPLKFIQSRIKEHLLADFPFPLIVHGCVVGRSPLTNAKAHPRTPLLVNLDLEDFYPSVTCEMVYRIWSESFSFGPPVASLLTRLTTYRGHVPQGAPTSGYLANIALLPAVGGIADICGRAQCEVTFYVDDISISGARGREVIEPLIALLREHYFKVGRGKTKIMPPSSAQITTGYTINSGRPSVPQPKRDRVRELIHELRVRRNLGSDFTKLLRSINGRIAHIERTNVGYADRLKRLLAREV